LAGLHERLRQEPCQTVKIAAAPHVELALEPLAASKGEEEPCFRGSEWLRPLCPAMPLPRPPSARKKTPSLSLQISRETGGKANPLRRAAAAARREGRGSEIDGSTPVEAEHGRCDP